MSNLAFKEANLIEQKDLREQLADRVEILDKVKKLFLIPELEIMTAKQIADYYNIPLNTVNSCYLANQDEIKQDGVVVKSIKDFLNIGLQHLETTQGKTVFLVTDDIKLEVPNRGIRCFSKRAILRFGMLLRDSEIAKEVRTQLLNTFEQATVEQKTTDIDVETNLISEIGKAAINGDVEALLVAYSNAIAFKNRHIAKIESENVKLTESNETLNKDRLLLALGILKWSERSSLNKAVRILAGKTSKSYGHMFNELYDELRYKHGIGLSQRGKPPLLQYIKSDEWYMVIQSFSAICVNNGFNPSKILERAKLDNVCEGSRD